MSAKHPHIIPLVALLIGHGGVSNDPGAVNHSMGVTELEYNTRLANKVHDLLIQDGKVDPVIVHRRTYRQLPADLNALAPKLILSFHLNAYNKKVSGTEFLHWHSSTSGQRFASILADETHATLQLPLRGDHGTRPRRKGQRGSHLLQKTKAPCVIAEPFFIDHDPDLTLGLERIDQLAQAYANAILRYFQA